MRVQSVKNSSPTKLKHFGGRAVAALIGLGGCAVGPDFHHPTAPSVSGYTREPLKTTVTTAGQSGAAQSFDVTAPIARDWWKLFGSSALSRLVEMSLTNNPTIEAANASLRQAAETTAAQRGFYFPTIQVGYSPSRQRNAVGTISPTLSSGQETYTLHTAQANVSYVLDVFGGNRRAVENLAAAEESQKYLLKAAELTVSSGMVVAAIQEAALREEVAVARKVVEINQHLVGLLREQVRIGFASGLDLALEDSSLAQAQQALPPLEKQWQQARDLIALLAGSPPSNSMESVEMRDLRLPETLPVSLPSELVRQRPDVLASEAQLHAASAAVGVAIANRLPQFAISGNLGGTATKLTEMFATGNVFWGLTGNLTETVFDGGTLRHRQRAAVAAFDAAKAQYQTTVLTAFQNVADTLYALDADAKALQAAVAGETAAQRTLDLVRHQVEIGSVAPISLWIADQAVQQARLTRLQAESGRLADSAALFQALGGGWWNAVAESSTNSTASMELGAVEAVASIQP